MSYKILIVDDSETIRTVIARTLHMAQVPVHSIYEASNGKEALEIIEREWIDLVFSDINMPVMNGTEFLKNLREKESLSDIPVVIISSEGSTQKIEGLLHQGIKAYIHKPFTPEQMKRVITEVLGE